MGRIVKVIAILFVIIIIGGYIFLAFTFSEDEEWITYVDGNVVQTINKSDNEIIEAQIETLKEKYETSDEYTYRYEFESSIYDSGEKIYDYVLTGVLYNTWTRSSYIDLNGTYTFDLCEAFMTITGIEDIDLEIDETIYTDTEYDSCLGLFVRLQTNGFTITETNNSTGEATTYYEQVTYVSERTYMPIYSIDQEIFFIFDDVFYQAKTIDSNQSEAILSSDDLVYASEDEFPRLDNYNESE